MSDKNFKLRKLDQQCKDALKLKDFAKLVDCYEKIFDSNYGYYGCHCKLWQSR